MLPRAYRIVRERDFVRMSRSRGVSFAEGIQINSNPNRLGYPRFAVVISKKTLKLATERNRLRRRIIALIARMPDTLGARDFLVRPRAELLHLQPLELKSRLWRAFRLPPPKS